MAFATNLHANFKLAGEFQEKVQRTKDDFGRPGLYFQIETLRGVFDFPVLDATVYNDCDLSRFDVVLVSGLLQNRSGRVNLIPTSFTRCEGTGLMEEAEKMIEFGIVSGQLLARRNDYINRNDDTFVPRVEVKGMGFVDSFVDPQIHSLLSEDKTRSSLVNYHANMSLNTQLQKVDGVWRERNVWDIENRVVDLPQRRRVNKDEMKQ